MGISGYLPSAQFAVIAGSIIVSGALVVAAQKITTPTKATSAALSTAMQPGPETDWQEALAQIQAESNISLPEPVNEATVDEFLTEARSSNVTATVARSLLINLSEAKSQGLGDDIPTQEKLIAEAVAQAAAKTDSVVYTREDLSPVPQTNASLRAYGNAVMSVLKSATGASVADTYMAMGYALDYNDKTKLATLGSVGSAYERLTGDLAAIEVPATLLPLHLSVVNKFADMTSTYEDMKEVFDDPLRGLAGLERYRLLQDEMSRLLTNIAQELQRNGILFSASEAGATWSIFLPQ